jgi:acylphosphatase
VAKFKDAGNFRMRTPGFRDRSFKERWGPANRVVDARPGVLVDEEGKEYPLREALPVEVAGPDVVVPEGLRAGKELPEKYHADLIAWVQANNPKNLPAINAHLREQGLKHMRVDAEQLKKLGIVLRKNRGYIVVEEDEDQVEALRTWVRENQPRLIGEIEAKRKELRFKKVGVSDDDLKEIGIYKLAGRYIAEGEEDEGEEEDEEDEVAIARLSREDKVARFQRWVRDEKPTNRDDVAAKRKALGLTPEKARPEALKRDGVVKRGNVYVVEADEDTLEQKRAKLQQWVRDNKPKTRDQVDAKRKELGINTRATAAEFLKDGVAKQADHYVVVG